MITRAWQRLGFVAGFTLALLPALAQSTDLGRFSGQTDIGMANKPGMAAVDPLDGTFLISGGGGRTLLTNEPGHFVWKQMSAADLMLAAQLHWPDTPKHPHGEACLMIRQTLEPDSVFAAAVLAKNGLARLKCRDTPGEAAHEIESTVSAPAGLRIEKHGDYITMSALGPDGKPGPAGGSFRVHFNEPFYAGLFVSATEDRSPAAIQFSNVDLLVMPPEQTNRFTIASTLESIDVYSSDRRVIYQSPNRMGAPNWSPDGLFILFGSGDRIWKLPLPAGPPQPINTETAIHCGSNHGLSPDGTLLAITDYGYDHNSRIYILPAAGGAPRQVSPDAPPYTVPATSGPGPSPIRRIVIPYQQTYWHDWSPDGKTIAYTAERGDKNDIYTLSLASGQERRLTTAPGINDGPASSPDGRLIYFCSDRGGLMQIWRMNTDGSEQMPLTADDYNDWAPHPSPDGRWLVFISYAPDVKGLPDDQDVWLRLMQLSTGHVQVLARLLGGHGTIDVPSWSPDSRHLAFISYQRIYP